MRRGAALLTIFAAGCTALQPTYVRPEPSVPVSWPVGDSYLAAAEADLPALTYKQVFTDARLQRWSRRPSRTIATFEPPLPISPRRASNTESSARTSSRRSMRTGRHPLPATRTNVGAQYQVGVSVPNFELDLFGRLRSLTDVQLNRYFATEAGARATRLTLVADIANAWLDHAADSASSRFRRGQPKRAKEREARAPKAGRRHRAPDRPRPGAADPRHRAGGPGAAAHHGRAGPQRASAPRWGADPAVASRGLNRRGIRHVRAGLHLGLHSSVLLRRPDVIQAEYDLRAANANIGAARAALFPKITLTGLLGFASSALLRSCSAVAHSDGARARTPPTRSSRHGHANVRLTQAQQRPPSPLIKGRSSGLPRRRGRARAAWHDQRRDRRAPAPAGGDGRRLPLTEARYNAGIDPFLTVLDAQRSYYAAQQTLVSIKLTAAQNIVATYQAIGGDALLESTPICQRLPGDAGQPNAVLSAECRPD